MAPFSDSGPHFASIVGAGALDTNGGPRINVEARVLGRGGQPIPGLFGAGNCVGSITGQAYWGPGGTIGPSHRVRLHRRHQRQSRAGPRGPLRRRLQSTTMGNSG